MKKGISHYWRSFQKHAFIVPRLRWIGKRSETASILNLSGGGALLSNQICSSRSCVISLFWHLIPRFELQSWSSIFNEFCFCLIHVYQVLLIQLLVKCYTLLKCQNSLSFFALVAQLLLQQSLLGLFATFEILQLLVNISSVLHYNIQFAGQLVHGFLVSSLFLLSACECRLLGGSFGW